MKFYLVPLPSAQFGEHVVAARKQPGPCVGRCYACTFGEGLGWTLLWQNRGREAWMREFKA